MLKCEKHKLIFCHIPKTGGTFISDAMKLLWDAKEIEGTGMHQPLSCVTLADREGYKTFASTRSPWTFYQSLWMHTIRAVDEPLNAFPSVEAADLAIAAMKTYGGGSLEWKKCLYGMTHLEQIVDLPESVGIFWGGPGVPFSSKRMGLYTWIHHSFLQGRVIKGELRPDVDIILRTEEGLAAQLAALTDTDVNEILRVFPRNTAPVEQERPELDNDCLDWIYMADASFAAQFGYNMVPSILSEAGIVQEVA